MKILITGSNGLLGQHLVDYCIAKTIDFLATSNGSNRNSKLDEGHYSILDIRDKNQIEKIFDQYKPTHVIHTAALTNVDYCELNPAECHETNVVATQLLFEASKKCNAHFEFVSTDFVFDGENGPYKETDKVNPLSIYAKSKVDAEAYIIQSDYKNWSIARTIIVYGKGENLSRGNLLSWSKETLLKGEKINIVNDQYRAPTFAGDLAYGCMQIVEKNQSGIFHLSGPETFSIYDIVKKVALYFKCNVELINPISSATLSQPAKRPPKTGFDISKARELLGYNPKTLEESFELI
jgi:dTDP-4-dehydrorhamnose reductase